MNQETRSKYADYIAAGWRYAMEETGLKEWPSGTIIIAKSYSILSEIDEIIGIKIFACDIQSPFDFFVAFPSEFQESYKLQDAFMEYLGIYDLKL
jgi:hypothetical protein